MSWPYSTRRTFFWLAARPQTFQADRRSVPGVLAGNSIWTGRTLLVGCAFESSEEPGEETLAFLAWGWLGPASSSDVGGLRLDETARLGGICRQRKRFGTVKGRKNRWLANLKVNEGSINDRTRDSKHDRTDQFEPLADSPNFNRSNKASFQLPSIPPVSSLFLIYDTRFVLLIGLAQVLHSRFPRRLAKPSGLRSQSVLTAMLTHRGFSAWIMVDGKPLPEYLVAVDNKSHRVSCWIPSEEGQVSSASLLLHELTHSIL